MQFHALKVKDVRRETSECVSVAFELPGDADFSYKAGQYLTFKHQLNGEELRRSYSICSSPKEGELRVAIKEVEGGRFSTFANRELKVGDSLESMAPIGNFTTDIASGRSKSYVMIAAGSGITPIMSLVKTILQTEANSKVLLIYGNKSPEQTIFLDTLNNLSAEYGDRFTMELVYSQSGGADTLHSGRIDEAKLGEFAVKDREMLEASEFFLCGPEALIKSAEDYLHGHGVNNHNIRFELFTTPVALEEQTEQPHDTSDFDGTADVTVIMDDEEIEFNLDSDGLVILDAAIDEGIDAPYSCKGAVCCTCKAKLLEGSVRMEMNYALSDEEIEDGFILTCQSHPTSAKVVVDYDQI